MKEVRISKNDVLLDFETGFGMLVSYNDGKIERELVDFLEESLIDTPEPECPDENIPEEEYRPATKLDDLTEAMLTNMAQKYSLKWRFPFKDSYLLLGLCWAQKWKLRDMMNIPPFKIEKSLVAVMEPTLICWINERIESGDLPPEEGEDLKQLVREGFLPDELAWEYFIYSRVRNFTGEVRLGPPQEEEEEESPPPPPEEREILRLIKSVVTATRGSYAYEFSRRTLSLIGALSDEKYKEYKIKYKRLLKKAWEIRKSLPGNVSLNERIKASRRIFV